MTCGQVFRWAWLSDGRWLGVEGQFWYLVSQSDSHYNVESNATEAQFRSLFRLDWDAAAIAKSIVSSAPELTKQVAINRGLRTMRLTSAEETLFSFMCTANNHVSRITQMIVKLAAYGEPLAIVEGVQLTAFPSAQRIAAINPIQLRDAGFGYRAEHIVATAQKVLSRDPVESLREVGYESATRSLAELPGIGRKLADCIALFGLDYSEAAPLDTHMWKAMTKIYFPEWQGKALTEARYKAASDLLRSKFGKYAGWAHQVLFVTSLKEPARRSQ